MNISERRAQRLLTRHQRLIELRNAACGGSAAEFARTLGIADTYAVRMFWPPGTKGRKGLGPDMESAIIDRFKLSPDWFDLPAGTALPIDTTNKAMQPSAPKYENSDADLLLRAFRAADPAVRAAWLDQARGILERIHTPSPLTGHAAPRAG